MIGQARRAWKRLFLPVCEPDRARPETTSPFWSDLCGWRWDVWFETFNRAMVVRAHGFSSYVRSIRIGLVSHYFMSDVLMCRRRVIEDCVRPYIYIPDH